MAPLAGDAGAGAARVASAADAAMTDAQLRLHVVSWELATDVLTWLNVSCCAACIAERLLVHGRGSTRCLRVGALIFCDIEA